MVETILRVLLKECLQLGGVVGHHPCCSRLKGTAEILLGVHHPQVGLVEKTHTDTAQLDMRLTTQLPLKC